MSSLLDDLYESIDITNSEPKQAFSITTQEQAIWALRKINRIEARRTEANETAKNEISRISEWQISQNAKCDSEWTYFYALLREYMFGLKETDPKLKTVSLPGGKLAIRKQQPEYSYDEVKLLSWAKDNLPDAVVTKESISKTVVKDYIKETGEILPGVDIQDRPDKFEIKLEA